MMWCDAKFRMEWVNGFPHQKIVLAQLSVENLRFEDKLINDHYISSYISSDWPVAYRMKYWSTLEHWNC